MLKKFVKGLTLAMLVFALIFLAACSSDDDTPDEPIAPDVEDTAETPPPADDTPDETDTPDTAFVPYDGIENFLIMEEMTPFTLFAAFGGDGAPEGHHPIWQEIARMTNMQMENVANPNIADAQEAINAMLTGGGDLPDIIFGQVHQLQAIAAQGGFIQLDDLIAEHAPNIQDYFQTIPDARVASTNAEGQTHFIVGTLNATRGEGAGYLIPTMMWFIRQDWLDILELEIPTTFDEFEYVLYAFRDMDPNGNGLRDEIPFFFRNGSPVGLYPLFGVEGNWAQWGVDEETNTVIFGRTSEAYRAALRTMSRWYADGIIDPEILSRGGNARQELWGNDIGGITFDWFESTVNMNLHEDIVEAVPDINIVPFLPPADIYGRVRNIYSQSPTSGWAWGISSDAADPVALIQFMDFMFSEPGSMLMTFGVYGKSHYIIDGEIVWSDEARNFGAGIPNYMRSIGAFGISGVMERDLSMMTDLAYAAYRLYVDADVLVPPFPTLSFTEEELDILARYTGAVETLWNQFEQQVLYGERDVDEAWAGYLAEMDALGLQYIIDVHNAAYQRWYAQFGG